MTEDKTTLMTSRCLHHGAAASSHRFTLDWLRKDGTDDCLVFSSHAMLNVARRRSAVLAGNGVKEENVWTIRETLRTSSLEQNPVAPGDSPPIISSMCTIRSWEGKSGNSGIVSGFSNGSINCWILQEEDDDSGGWREFTVSAEKGRSVSTVSAVSVSKDTVLIAAGTSSRATLYICSFSISDSEMNSKQVPLLDNAVCSVYFQPINSSSLLVLVGTASPRHNKIHVYRLDNHQQAALSPPHYVGALSGHEDWITSFDWWHPRKDMNNSANDYSSLLASASQDARIRLWMFRITMVEGEKAVNLPDDAAAPIESDKQDEDDDDDDVILHQGIEEDEEGESRMEIVLPRHETSSLKGGATTPQVVRVTLEALLMGHEESVTSVKWHPNPRPYYGYDQLLISSSMDRAIMLWGPSPEGIWTPLTRVGSAGGILGGSVGSTLLGYCGATVDPTHGTCLIGHAYGGSLHMWSLQDKSNHSTKEKEAMSMEERASYLQWKATPCITGHFDGVTDLCWESTRGEYLLTVSNDQTCRLWALIRENDEDKPVWVELARPQVHGYALSAITSISSSEHKHTIVTGADEKELRVFDAPQTTLRVLQAIGNTETASDRSDRVERAYIPSLGLSNKAKASDAAEEDDVLDGADTPRLESSDFANTRLPLERDLGAVSLWPEIRKLFGHNTELYCLASTLEARKSLYQYHPRNTDYVKDLFVASSCKARDAEAAKIRIWDVATGKCAQILSGGHKSTVATLAFSPDGQYLASSGKDRRLCIWARSDDPTQLFQLAWARDTAHKRIVWSVGFCPFDESLLASGSRDGCIKLWRIKSTESQWEVAEVCSFAPHFSIKSKPDSVTALAFAPKTSKGMAILAMGLESGRIELFGIALTLRDDASSSSSSPQLLLELPSNSCHVSTVTKLAWKPLTSDEEPLLLASCSLDWGCRITEIKLSGEQ